MTTPLERALNKASELQAFGKALSAWESLAGKEDLLREGLRWGVENFHDPSTLPRMKICFEAISSNAARQQVLSYCRTHYKPTAEDEVPAEGRSDTINATRLHEEACALVATALAAVAYKKRTTEGDPAELLRWWRLAAGHLHEPPPEQQLSLPDAWAASVDDLSDALVNQGWDLTTTRYWTAWWLRKGGGWEGKTQSIGVAATYGPKNRSKGFVADLVLEAIPGRPGRLIEHPEAALLPLSDRWLATLRAAEGNYGRALCWCVRCPDSVPWEQRAFFGDSHGGAAAWGFWHVGQGKIADDRVIALTSCLEIAPGASVLGQVGGVTAKVKAIEQCVRPDGTARFDTIVVTGEQNEKEAIASLCNKSRIRVRNLETEGEAVG
jgi:hypothetical protein